MVILLQMNKPAECEAAFVCMFAILPGFEEPVQWL